MTRMNNNYFRCPYDLIFSTQHKKQHIFPYNDNTMHFDTKTDFMLFQIL